MQKENPVKSQTPLLNPNTGTGRRGRFSPLRLFVIMLVSIFFAEIIAMTVVYFIAPLSYQLTTLIDAGIMVALIFPVLYWLSFNPLIQHIEKLQQAEAKLESERARLRSILDTLPDGIYIVNQQFDVEYVNPVIEREFGLVDGQKCYSYFHDSNEACHWCKNPEVLEGKSAHWEWVSSKTGKTYDVFDTPLHNSDGSFSKLKIVHDITERKRAEDQFREMALFPALNPDAVMQVDGNGRIKKSNPAAKEMGFDTDTNLLELIPDLAKLNFPELIAAGFTKICEAWSGERVLYWTMRGVPDLGLAFLYSTDITERKRSEDAVRLLSSVVEQTADTVVVTDCDGVIEYVNPAFESLTGYRKEEALGQTPRVLKSGIHEQQFYSKLWQTVLGAQVFQGEITNRKKNGELFYEAKTIAPLRDAQGDITHFVATGKDITERRQAEETLRRAYDDLEVRVQRRTVELKIANSELEDEIKVRRQAEEALKQSEQRLKRAQEIAHLGSWELDLVNNQLTWSDEVYRIFGLQPQEFDATYEAFLHAVHPDDRGAVDEAYAGSIREGTDAYEIEHRIVKRSNSEVRMVHEKCEHYRNTAGGIILSVGMVHDITERKQAEEALRTSEEKFRRAFADAAIAFAMTTPEGRFLDANPAYCLLTGCTLADLQEIDFQSLIHPDDRAANMKLIDRMLAGEITDFVVENRYLRKDDKTVWVRKSISLVRTADGSPQWIIALVEDINERKQAEEALRLAHEKLEVRVRERTEDLAAANWELSNEISERKEIERQLRIQTAAMEAAANGILITDPQGCILWTNPAITQISGYEERDLMGQSTDIFNSGQHDAKFYRHMWETILSGQVWHGETTNRRKDGVLYVEEQTITPVQNEEGELSHFIAIKQDITERKLIYAQLEGSNRDLQTLTAAERQQRFLAEGLVESSVVLNMSLDLRAVLDHIFEQTRRTIPCLMADIVLIEGDVANVVRQWGEDTPEAKTISENDTLSLQQFPIWEEICATKSAHMIPDTSLDDQWNSYFGMSWIRSYLGAPLIYSDQVIGIINLSSDQENAFDQEMAKSLRAFAAPAAVAIQNARLYEDEKQNRKVAEILSAASMALAQTLDIQTVMETILDYLQVVMPCDIAFVILSEGEERYRIRAVRASDDPPVQDALRDRTIDILTEPIISSYFNKDESTFIPDSREIPDWSPPVELTSFHCWLGIPLGSMGKSLGMVVIAHATPNCYTQYQIRLAEAVIKQAVVALQNAWLFEQVRSGRERLQQLSRHLVEIQENERKYIARELHDETSQSLTSLKMGLQVIEQKAAGHPQLMEQVVRLKDLADETLESLHHLAVNLRPASLDHLGLVDALTGLIESTRQRTGMTAHFKTMGPTRNASLTDEIEASIYRIVQESLTNVLRHAHANYVDIILEWQADKIVIIIEDDGVGIDMQKARETGHLGLIGMQERAEMLGGKLLVDSTPQVGTTLVVEIPYVNSNTDSR